MSWFDNLLDTIFPAFVVVALIILLVVLVDNCTKEPEVAQCCWEEHEH